MSMARTRADVRGKPMSPPCNCRLHACKRSCLRSAAVFRLSNARVVGGATSFRACAAHASVFVFFEEHFRGNFQAVFYFLKDNQGATDAGPRARTLTDTRQKLAGTRGICYGAPYRKNQTNQTAARKLTCTDMGESGYMDTDVMYSPQSHNLVLSTT